MRGVGAKYEAATLQGLLLMPRGAQATVIPASGEPFTGRLLFVTDFGLTGDTLYAFTLHP